MMSSRTATGKKRKMEMQSGPAKKMMESNEPKPTIQNESEPIIPNEPNQPILTLELINGWTYKLTTNTLNKDYDQQTGELKLHGLFVRNGNELYDELDLAEIENWEFKNELATHWVSLQDGLSSMEFWAREYKRHGRYILPAQEYFRVTIGLRQRIAGSLELSFNTIQTVSTFYNDVKTRLGVDFELRLLQIKDVRNVTFFGRGIFKKGKNPTRYLLWSIRVQIDPVTYEYKNGTKSVANQYGNPIANVEEEEMVIPSGSLSGLVSCLHAADH